MALPVLIIPGESVGPYRLGMTRQDVWAQDRSPIRAFFKTPASKDRTDNILKFGLHVFYGESGCCDYMEAWTKTEHFHTELLLGERLLSGKTMREVREILVYLRTPFLEDEFGFQARAGGIGFYCHSFESDDSLLDGVSVMKKEPNQPPEPTRALRPEWLILNDRRKKAHVYAHLHCCASYR